MDNKNVVNTLLVLGLINDKEYKSYKEIDVDIKRFVNLLKNDKKNLSTVLSLVYYLCSHLKFKRDKIMCCDDLYNLLVIYNRFFKEHFDKLLNDMEITIALGKEDFGSIRSILRKRRILLVSKINSGYLKGKCRINWNDDLWYLVQVSQQRKDFVSISSKEEIENVRYIEIFEDRLEIHKETFNYDSMSALLDESRDRVFVV